MSKQKRVSVIMRSKNSDWVIDRALAGLFSQTYVDFELIVVDSGSTDTTLDIVKSYPCRLIEIEPGSYYPGKVLNDAVKQADTELIVFQNSDVLQLGPHCLERLVGAFDNEEVQAAFARQVPRPEADPWVRRDYAASFPAEGDAPEWLPYSLPFAGLRKSLWEQRPFYTDAWASEDSEWGLWARSQGYKIQYVPDCTVMHSHNYTLSQIYGRRFVEGEADAFIQGDDDSLLKMVYRTCKSTLNDAVFHLSEGEIRELTKIPARRLTYHWAYYRGRTLGTRRRNSKDVETSIGQQIVLARHESVQQSS